MGISESVGSRVRALIQGGVAATAAAVLALSCSVGAPSAYATDTTSTYYDLPKANEVIDFSHTTTDNGASYTYHYLTIGCSYTGRVAPMMQTWYETLGFNYINAYTGPHSIYNASMVDGKSDQIPLASNGLNTSYTGGSVGSLTSRNATLAIIGSSNNENPDEYIWNYCAWANGADSVTADKRALDRGNSTSGALSVSIGDSVYDDFPREVYTECDIIGAVPSVDGKYAPEGLTAAYGDKTFADWIELENGRANRPKGSGTYNPQVITGALQVTGAMTGGGAAMVSGLHTLASAADTVINASKDANGNHTVQTRYGGNVDNSTGKSIDKYEDLVQATQYYTMSKIEDGTVDKAVTAMLVGYDPATGNYACRKYAVTDALNPTDTTKAAADPNVNFYGGRGANYLASISTSIADLGLTPAQQTTNDYENAWIAWFTPEQIAANADAVFVCDAPSSNSISQYLATASDGKCYVVYAPATVSASEEDRTAGLIQARDALKAAGKPVADFCFSYPANMFGNFYAQGVENGMHAVIDSAFTYPELFNLTDMLAYWAKNVWHVKDSALQSIVTSTTASMSLVGTEIGTISGNYATNAENVFNEGNKFYIAHQTEIDAINSGNLKTYDLNALQARTAGAPALNSGAALTKATATAVSPAQRNAKSDTPAATDKKANTMTVKASTVTASAKKKTTIKAAKAFTVTKAQGKVTYKKTKGDGKITVAKAGNVTVKKGLKAGTYKVKVKVTAAGNSKYKSASKTVTLKVKVK